MSVRAPALKQPNITNPARSTERPDVLSFIGTVATGAALIIACITLVWGGYLALRWYNQPFLGAFATQTGVFIGTRPLGEGAWPGVQAGISQDDQLRRLDAVNFTSFTTAGVELNDVLATKQIGQTINLRVLRPESRLAGELPANCVKGDDGALCDFGIQLIQIPLLDFLGFFGIGYGVAVILVGFAIWLWIRYRTAGAVRTLIVMCAAGAIFAIGRFEVTSTFQFSVLMKCAAVVIGAMLMQYGLLFPYPFVVVRRYPVIRLLNFVAAFVVLGIAMVLHFQYNPATFDLALLLCMAYGIVGGTYFMYAMFYRQRTSTSSLVREQATVAMVSLIVPMLPIALWLVTNTLERTQILPNVSFSTIYLQPPLILFPLGMIYAVLQRRVDSDRLLSDTLVLSVLGLLLTGGYLAVTGAAVILTSGVIRPNNPVIIAVTLFVIALLFTPMRVRLERFVERTFFRQRQQYGHRLEQFARSLAVSVRTDEIISGLEREITQSLAPQYVFVFLRDMITGDLEPVPQRVGKAQTDIRFKSDAGLARLLETSTESVINLSSADFAFAELGQDRPRLAVLNTPIIVRMRSARRVNGFLALGPQRDNVPYTFEDLRFLEGIATQAAAALERAQVVLEAQQNERELGVLVQASAGLNIAMDFNTLLEFIYTQVNKVIKAPNFYIVLRDENTGELTYVFYQDADERDESKEGMRWQIGRDLFSEVVKTAQPFRTDNFPREMARRSLAPENPAVRAWLGVPLNAGEGRCIGVLALSNTDPNVIYTEEQTKLFWNIADLAAAAIYKQRLLEESSSLARQMQILNETSSELAAYFEDVDALLQNIVQSAVTILDGEAGSLLLVDEDTNELEFSLAYGGAGETLIGERIPIGQGIAGTVAATGQYVITNDVQRDPRWLGEVTLPRKAVTTGFSTTCILAVPLLARNRVLGVLEIINRRDGSGFDANNANLLMTFAGQAAMALENANLFRKTDEALAERLRQLFNMTRIDQELNRTLDFNRVVALTVDNAIRESEADAGLLAMITPDRSAFEIVGSAGYPERVVRTHDVVPIDEGILGYVYRAERLIVTPSKEIDPHELALLPGSEAQIAVPMFTGDSVTGVLLLETTQPEFFSHVTAEHIQSIAEHANTAISNAQLFAQLQRANSQRSQFIGHVAHEFKNPLASIKGYVEFLSSGVVGPLNGQQQNFVTIIQRNAVRLEQLMRDFQDVTAQETGNLKLNMAAVKFHEVVLDAVRTLQRSIDEKNQEVHLDVSEDLPSVWADSQRLVQIMINFVSNANKYTEPDGDIYVTAAATQNVWDINGAPEVIHCAVKDTGIGMSEADLNNLFKAYWRSDNPKAREQAGTGLGMSLTRGLIEAHGGRIWVESQLGEGTTFHFTIPLAGEREKMVE